MVHLTLLRDCGLAQALAADAVDNKDPASYMRHSCRSTRTSTADTHTDFIEPLTGTRPHFPMALVWGNRSLHAYGPPDNWTK